MGPGSEPFTGSPAALIVPVAINNPHFPPSGPIQWLFQGPPAESKVLGSTAPTAVASGTTSGTAVYNQTNATGPADITNAGGLSAYGTMEQNGNVWEWGESGFTAPNDSAGESRVFRGGDWNGVSSNLASSSRINDSPTGEDDLVGFRVAAVPEPSAFLLTLIGTLGVVLGTKRG